MSQEEKLIKIESSDRWIDIYEQKYWGYVYRVYMDTMIHLPMKNKWEDVEKYAEECMALLPKNNKDSFLIIYWDNNKALKYIDTLDNTSDFLKNADKYILINWKVEKV